MSHKRASIEDSIAHPVKRRSARVRDLGRGLRQRALLCDSCRSITIPNCIEEAQIYCRPYGDLSRDAEAGCRFCSFIRDRFRCAADTSITLSIAYRTSADRPAKVNFVHPNAHSPDQEKICFDICRVPAKILDTIDEIALQKGFYGHNFEGTYSDHDVEDRNSGMEYIPRVVASNPLSHATITLVREWFQKCSQHPICPPVHARPLPSRLLDVRDPQQLKLTQHQGSLGSYTILSHTWGSVDDIFSTNIDNLESRLNGFDARTLPRNFQDAVEFTRALGYGYLWIDGLCILQHDENDWNREAAKMADYYSNAVATLSATDALTCHEGFLRHRALQHSAPIGQDVWFCLRDCLPDEMSMNMSAPVSKRAWTLQERLISPRTIHFTKSQIVWICGEGHWCEGYQRNDWYQSTDFCSRLSHFVIHKDQWDLYWLERNGIAGPLRIDDACESWYQCLSEYSARFLSRPSDKLGAIAGLATKFCKPELGRYLAGIWETDLFRGLAWQKIPPLDVEKPRTGPVTYLEAKSRSTLALKSFRPPLKYRAPSWSWASQNGPLEIHCNMFWFAKRGATPAMLYELNHWKREYQPRLHSCGLRHATENTFLDVQEGSYIEIEGFCRDLWVCHGEPTQEKDFRGRLPQPDGPDGPFIKKLIFDEQAPSDQVSCFLKKPCHLATASVQKYLILQICKQGSGDRLVYALLLSPVVVKETNVVPDNIQGNVAGVEGDTPSGDNNDHDNEQGKTRSYKRVGLVQLACYNLCQIPERRGGSISFVYYLHPVHRPFGAIKRSHYKTKEWQKDKWVKMVIRLY